MPGTDLVGVDQKRQIRSYHQAFTGDLTVYELGKDIRLWRPISARQIFWTFALVIVAIVVARIAGVHLVVFSMGWFFVYFLGPCGLGWLFARALVEGRRLHVVLLSWARHALYGSILTGGYRTVRRHRPLRKTRIKVAPTYQIVQPFPIWCGVVAILVLGIVAAVVVAIARQGTASVSPRPPQRLPVTQLIIPAAHTQQITRIVTAHRERAVRHATARRPSSPRRAVVHFPHRPRTSPKLRAFSRRLAVPAVATSNRRPYAPSVRPDPPPRRASQVRPKNPRPDRNPSAMRVFHHQSVPSPDPKP